MILFFFLFNLAQYSMCSPISPCPLLFTITYKDSGSIFEEVAKVAED